MFNDEIVHRGGKRNPNADAISRIPYSDEEAPTPSSTSVAAVDLDMVGESNPTLLGHVIPAQPVSMMTKMQTQMQNHT